MKSAKKEKDNKNAKDRPIATNRKAYHNYLVQESLEAGIVLTGTEIKSIRGGRVSLGEAYVRALDGELWLVNAHVAHYQPSGIMGHDATRKRKLLLHRRQINSLTGKIQEKGLTLVPLKLYLKNGRAKLQVAVARGKKQYDKREVIARRDSNREIERTLKRRG